MKKKRLNPTTGIWEISNDGGKTWIPTKHTAETYKAKPKATNLDHSKKTVRVTSAPKFDTSSPYYNPKDIEQFVIPGTVMREGQVEGLQHEIEPGVYGDKEITVDQFMKNNPSWAKEFEKRHPGETFDPKKKEYVKEFQEFYTPTVEKNVFNNLVETYMQRGASKDQAEKLAKPLAKQVASRLGFDPNYKKGMGNPRGIDSDFGQFTQSRVEVGYKEPVTPKKDTPPASEKPVEPNTPVQADHLEMPRITSGTPWWLQDIIKTAHAAGNLARIKKYEPWQATPNVYAPRVAFFDPNRELAANAEMANIAGQTLAQFTGPQSFNARYSDIQGKGLSRAADTISRVHNQNVDMSNRQEALNADMMNRASEMRAHGATSLWDKYQTVNQQFDNAKSQARDALVNQYVNAITNRAYTANLNKLYPQFSVNPASGGDYYFENPREILPDSSKQKTFTEVYNQLLSENPTLKAHPEKVADIAMKQLGISMPENPYLQYRNRGVIPQYYPGVEEDQGYGQ